jgi:hypothetical protein
MPLSPEQEALCERLEKGESTPAAAALIRQQANEIDDLWDRLSRAYALVREESPAEMIQEEMKQLQAMLEGRRNSQPRTMGSLPLKLSRGWEGGAFWNPSRLDSITHLLSPSRAG